MIKKTSIALLGAFTLGFVLTFVFPPPKEANAQVFGPTTRTPQLTVSPGATTVQDLTINGTCTGCPTLSNSAATVTGNTESGDCSTQRTASASYKRVANIVFVQVTAAGGLCTASGFTVELVFSPSLPATTGSAVGVKSACAWTNDTGATQVGRCTVDNAGRLSFGPAQGGSSLSGQVMNMVGTSFVYATS